MRTCVKLTCVLACQVHALGSNTVQTSEKWGSPELGYRKREGYIAAGRKFLKRGNLKNWNHFLHKDLEERNMMTLTFNERHLPLSDGKKHKEFGKFYKEAAEWLQDPSPVKKKKRKSPAKKEQPQAKKAKVEVEVPAADTDEDDVIMVVCAKTGKVVPLIDLA